MKKIVGILIIIILGICLLKPKENVKLDNVILKQEVNNKTFAMYKEEGEGYTKVEDNKFPEGYALNVTESNCIDNNGNEIKDALSYENGEVTITSGKTIYCYLYFDKTLGVEIKEKEPKGLKTDAIRGEMYRFQGQQSEGINNYICFGTSNKEDCINDTDHYMYRIIGIEASTGRVKVIKKEALNNWIKWWDNTDDNIEFPDSNVFKEINGNSFLKNLTYMPEGWEEKIAINSWMYGDMLYHDSLGSSQTASELYLVETGQKGTIWDVKADQYDPNAQQFTVINNHGHLGETFYYVRHVNELWTKNFKSKISLMYLHDFYFSVNDRVICTTEDTSDSDICVSGWINLFLNDKDYPNVEGNEWTMSRVGWGRENGYMEAYRILKDGAAMGDRFFGTMNIRPVFYINASEELLSKDATGTLEDPFIIKS